MTLLTLALIVFFVLYGLTSLGWIAVSGKVLGAVALVVAVLLVFSSIGGRTIL